MRTQRLAQVAPFATPIAAAPCRTRTMPAALAATVLCALTGLACGCLPAAAEARGAQLGPEATPASATQVARAEERAQARARRAALREERRRDRVQRGAGGRAGPEARYTAPRSSGTPGPAAARHHREPHERLPNPEREHAVVYTTCHQALWTLRKFPDLPDNVVREKLRIEGLAPVFSYETFGGATGSNTEAINALPGAHNVDTGGHWKTNGVRGAFDIHSRKRCPPAPAYTIEKTQKLAGTPSAFTASPLIGEVGQTVDYQIVVQNTGNVPLTVSRLEDVRCDPDTLAGGPTGPLSPGAVPSLGGTATWTCSHLLTSADQTAGSYENAATATAVAPAGDGTLPPERSDTVVVGLPAPAFTIEKTQRIGAEPFTSATLSGEAGQRVDYEITVTDTGNTPLVFSQFSDPHCDTGTLAGGPATALSPGGSAVWSCSHSLTASDQAVGSYENSASVQAMAPDPPGFSHASNTVVVTVAAAPQELVGPLSATAAPALAAATAGAPRSGVLGSAASRVPSLHGPQGCTRASARVWLSSAGVRTVTFYLDGRKLRTMTARSARRGQFLIVIDVARLRVGVHRLTARITMAAGATTARVVHATRSLAIVRCAEAVRRPSFTG